MSAPDLLPCPFCGRAPVVRTWAGHGVTVGCGNVACPCEPCADADTLQLAAGRWNARPKPTDTARLDWLEAHGTMQFQKQHGAPSGRLWFDTETKGSDYSPTLRAAIDAAMAGESIFATNKERA